MRFLRATVFVHLILVGPLIFGVATRVPPTRTDKERVAPHPKKETNADRFRRGLGPLPPTRRDRNKLSSRASAVPCTRLSNNVGRIQIRRLAGDKIGFVGDRYNDDDAYRVRARRAALSVTVPPVTPFGGAIDLIAVNPPDSSNPYFGAVSNGLGNLGAEEAGFAYLSGISNSVRSNSPPSFNAGTSLTLNGHGGVETQIWTMNCQTHEITAQWINADGSQPPTTIFYDPRGKFLGLTGNLGAVDPDAFPVTITFVQD
ncbi:hypothetical protein C8R44DRAFT_858714 [Mycena epipterygia]|nr:hypothetical protein C8R44DRAFT_858714 [Mycena epipterygia]